jgi:formyltetrahydrofolate synthetase
MLSSFGVPISWKSKGQKSVTLSSSEAEFVALTEAAKEVKFIVQIIQPMGIPLKLSAIYRVDNVGVIFMAEKINTTSRSKDTDLKLRWLNELVVDEKLLKIVFVKSEDNVSDWFTKDVNSQLYLTHRKQFWKRSQPKTKTRYQYAKRKGVGIWSF